MATLKQKKKLIKTIKNPERYFKLDFTRYGGEVAMGTITKDQFEYWSDKDGFEEYMASVDFRDAEMTDKDIPKRAQFDKPFYEYGDICHLSGPELVDGQTLYHNRTRQGWQALQDDDGDYIEAPDGGLWRI